MILRKTPQYVNKIDPGIKRFLAKSILKLIKVLKKKRNFLITLIEEMLKFLEN